MLASWASAVVVHIVIKLLLVAFLVRHLNKFVSFCSNLGIRVGVLNKQCLPNVFLKIASFWLRKGQITSKSNQI